MGKSMGRNHQLQVQIMQRISLLALIAGASACVIPTTPLSNTITTPFRIQVQNASYPAVNNLYMNLLEAGGGDKHLYIGPVGTPTSNLVLTGGVIEQGVVHADDTLTNNKCMTFCAGRGYKYAGTEYARECWCGNSYAPSRQPKTTKVSLAGCSTKCKGNTAQYCGGGDWLSLYQACPAGGPCVNAVFT